MDQTAGTFFAVIIPTYNAEKTLARALDSLIDQTFPDWQAIIVDDTSLDATRDIASRYAARDSRFHLIALPRNAGPAAARNAGIAYSKSEWITLLDADDAYQPGRLFTFHQICQESDVSFVADNLICYDAYERKTTGLAFSLDEPVVPFTLCSLANNDGPGRNYHAGWLKPAFKRSLLLAHGLRYDESLRVGEDFLLYAGLLMASPHSVMLNEAHYIYTTPIGAVSQKRSSSHTTVKLEDLICSAENFARQIPSGDGRTAFEARIDRLKKEHAQLSDSKSQTAPRVNSSNKPYHTMVVNFAYTLKRAARKMLKKPRSVLPPDQWLP